jgi:hypothetical protein
MTYANVAQDIDPEAAAQEPETGLINNTAVLSALNRSEIDQQVSTAKKYPRTVKRFVTDARELVTLNEEVAADCIYSLPRGKKPIEGPSARFAEILAHSWQNCRAGSRILDEDEKTVSAQGFFIDCQTNVTIVCETQRRITDKEGNRFNDDMVTVTANAAASIAMRNAILRGIPKALWNGLYLEARQTAIGNAETLAGRRAKMMQAFGKMGVTPAQIFRLLEVDGEEDITLDHLATLRGMYSAIREGDNSVDEAFMLQAAPAGSASPAGKASPSETEKAKK